MCLCFISHCLTPRTQGQGGWRLGGRGSSSPPSLPSLGKSNRWWGRGTGGHCALAWEGRRAQCVSGRRWMPSLPCESWETAAGAGWWVGVGCRGWRGGDWRSQAWTTQRLGRGPPPPILRDPLKKQIMGFPSCLISYFRPSPSCGV